MCKCAYIVLLTVNEKLSRLKRIENVFKVRVKNLRGIMFNMTVCL